MVLEFLCTRSPSHLSWLLLSLYTPPAGAFTWSLVCSCALGCDFQVKFNKAWEGLRPLAGASVTVNGGRHIEGCPLPAAFLFSGPVCTAHWPETGPKAVLHLQQKQSCAASASTSSQVFASGRQSIFASVRRRCLTQYLECVMYEKILFFTGLVFFWKSSFSVLHMNT